MTFYQELQLSSAGSKQLIKNTTEKNICHISEDKMYEEYYKNILFFCNNKKNPLDFRIF